MVCPLGRAVILQTKSSSLPLPAVNVKICHLIRTQPTTSELASQQSPPRCREPKLKSEEQTWGRCCVRALDDGRKAEVFEAEVRYSPTTQSIPSKGLGQASTSGGCARRGPVHPSQPRGVWTPKRQFFLPALYNFLTIFYPKVPKMPGQKCVTCLGGVTPPEQRGPEPPS